MCLLLESIKIDHGHPCHLNDHENRMNRSRRILFGINKPIFLSKDIADLEDTSAIFKCRIIYDNNIRSVEFQHYQPRIITSLKLIERNDMEYSFKYADRGIFSSLPAHEQDEEFLIIKNGFITDTTFSNIVFYDGRNWITPSTYLLNGTQRQRLLKTGRIISQNITMEDLRHFRSAKLINAMLDFDTTPEIAMSDIYRY